MAERTYISLRAFAEIVGVSNTAISKAIESGRLVKSVKFGPNGEKLGIDPVAGQEEWELSNPARASKKTAAENGPDKPLPSGPSFAQARAVRETYQARIAKIIYEEKIGKLVDASAVKLKAFETARTVRDFILNIPNRISAELAAETDPVKIHALLTKELNESLDELARFLKDGT